MGGRLKENPASIVLVRTPSLLFGIICYFNDGHGDEAVTHQASDSGDNLMIMTTRLNDCLLHPFVKQ